LLFQRESAAPVVRKSSPSIPDIPAAAVWTSIPSGAISRTRWTTCGWLGSSEAEGLFLDKKDLKVFNRLISMHCVVEEPDGGGKR
jgi:hypothetical protein